MAGLEHNILKVCRFVWRCLIVEGSDPFLRKSIYGFTPEIFTLKTQKKLVNTSFSRCASILLHKYGAANGTWTLKFFEEIIGKKGGENHGQCVGFE